MINELSLSIISSILLLIEVIEVKFKGMSEIQGLGLGNNFLENHGVSVKTTKLKPKKQRTPETDKLDFTKRIVHCTQLNKRVR